ncbi:MAG TPA: UbiA family prenyltransferase [Blastocatellia bacterium]|nr:UbiA family prenyltransferase [Blastocatellia bacterium]
MGAILFARPRTWDLAITLPLVYLSFNVLLYGGIYTINAIADRESDARHPRKRNRPLPSGSISLNSAMTWMSLLIASGLASGFVLFGIDVFYIYVVAIGLNLLYSYVARQIPYLELVVNASTHPLRFVLGTSLVNCRAPLLLLAAIFLLALGIASARRRVEKSEPGWEARNTLKCYSLSSLKRVEAAAFIGLTVLLLVDRTLPDSYYVVLMALYLVMVTAIDHLGSFKNLFVRVWTR